MSADDLDTLDPQPAVVQFRGERLEIRPLTVGQLPRFSRLVRPVVDDFVAGNEAWSLSDDVMVAEVMEKHGEAIIEAAALACGRPVEFIAGNRNAAELLDLAHRVVEVNRDFFFRTVRAAMLGQSLARTAPTTDGPETSTTSSAPATP
ncbi:MAG: hypothetical protein LCH59_06600 [Proteobacteria bacterium]|nr:hypothetical protein [Pseudomonadota bacterium]